MGYTGEKKRAYQREWLRKRREEFFSDKSCTTCGSKENLELHHLDKTTKVDHRIWSWAEQRRTEEISKCIILCSICHDHAEWGKPQHGTYRMYKHHRCRCNECRKANAAFQRQWLLG